MILMFAHLLYYIHVSALLSQYIHVGGFRVQREVVLNGLVLNGLMVGQPYDITALVGKIRHTDTCTGE